MQYIKPRKVSKKHVLELKISEKFSIQFLNHKNLAKIIKTLLVRKISELFQKKHFWVEKIQKN